MLIGAYKIKWVYRNVSKYDWNRRFNGRNTFSVINNLSCFVMITMLIRVHYVDSNDLSGTYNFCIFFANDIFVPTNFHHYPMFLILLLSRDILKYIARPLSYFCPVSLNN